MRDFQPRHSGSFLPRSYLLLKLQKTVFLGVCQFPLAACGWQKKVLALSGYCQFPRNRFFILRIVSICTVSAGLLVGVRSHPMIECPVSMSTLETLSR